MNWAAFYSVFFVATFKFLFSPLAGIPLGLNFFTTYLSAISGATISSLFFYYSAGYIIKLTNKNRKKKERKLLKRGVALKTKKYFTRGNKLTIRIKGSFGKYGLCLLAPSLLSIPIGTIIVAKFYGKDKDTFLWVFVGILICGLISTTIVYFLFSK